MGDSMISRSNMTTRDEQLRLDFGKKQGEIADILGVKRNTYSKWENMINDMKLEKSNELANYYDSSLDYLLGLSNVKEGNFKCLNINYNILTKRLKELRDDNHLTQKYLSDKLGFPQTTYSQYEVGTAIPTTLKLLVVATYYNVSVDYLTGRSDDKEIK